MKVSIEFMVIDEKEAALRMEKVFAVCHGAIARQAAVSSIDQTASSTLEVICINEQVDPTNAMSKRF